MLWKGNKYEGIALKHLQKHNLKLIERNFHSRHGEIDLIMKDRNELTFIEVRYRKNDNFGSALESVTLGKQRKILKCAQYYLTKTNNHDMDCRFDVVAISETKEACNNLNIEWIKAAFTG